ncbi:MAG TPA: nuclear transport factor 2 family protein [Longimicrobiales bacterium]|nr:nuclear transport factor 2 family protein [Longimicrobiales bacterium]
MRYLLATFGIALVCSGPAYAQSQDAASVCAASERHYAAIRAGDDDAVMDQHLPDVTLFGEDGGLLWSLSSNPWQPDPSSSSTTFIRHCSAQVYGNVGIATFYLVGSWTYLGNTRSGTWRVTEVWVKQGNEWKEAHHHESPLLDSVVGTER